MKTLFFSLLMSLCFCTYAQLTQTTTTGYTMNMSGFTVYNLQTTTVQTPGLPSAVTRPVILPNVNVNVQGGYPQTITPTVRMTPAYVPIYTGGTIQYRGSSPASQPLKIIYK